MQLKSEGVGPETPAEKLARRAPAMSEAREEARQSVGGKGGACTETSYWIIGTFFALHVINLSPIYLPNITTSIYLSKFYLHCKIRIRTFVLILEVE